MAYLPEIYQEFEREYPTIAKEYGKLALACHKWGPLDEKTRRLVKLGIAIGLCSEGAVRSHTRRALEIGISSEEIRHVLLLSFTTIGFPEMQAAMKWIEQVPGMTPVKKAEKPRGRRKRL